MRNRVLVCGSGGFIGSHMAKFLYNEGFWVRAVDIDWDDYISEPFCHEKRTLDLRDQRNCLEACEDIDYVFQFAANMGGIGYITSVFADIARDNTLINLNMLEAVKATDVKRMLFSSSACVYPNYKQQEANVVELEEKDAMPADPNEIYGWEKLYTEQLYNAYIRDYDMDLRMVRFHNVYGQEGTYKGGKEKAPAALCRKVAKAKLKNENSITVWGDGKQTRSFMYIEDCCKGLYEIFFSSYDKPINLGRDRLVEIDYLAETIMEIAGVELYIKHDTSKPQGVRGRNSDNTLCKKILGWEPEIPIEEGLEQTYKWIENQVRKDLGIEKPRSDDIDEDDLVVL